MFLRVTGCNESKSICKCRRRSGTLLGSNISETMAAIPPDVDKLTDEEEVDEENLNAPTFCDIPRAGISKLFLWRAILLIF